MVTIGVVGVGRIGTMHTRHLRDHPAVQDVILYDENTSAARRVAEITGARVAGSLPQLLAEVDGVVIATPSATHIDLIRAAAAKGRAIFCEKPLALDLAAADEVIADVHRAGVPLQVGFHRRCDPAYLRLREHIAAGRYGEVLMIRTVAFDHEPPPAGLIGVSGDIFADCLCHDLDVVRWLTGREITAVSAVGSVLTDKVFAEHDDVDVAATTVTLDGGVLAVLAASRRDPEGYDHRLEVLGTRASVAVGINERTPLRHLDGRGPRQPHLSFLDRFATAYLGEMRAFVDLCRGAGPNPCPPEDARKAMVAAAAAGLARRTGRSVSLTEQLVSGR